MSTTSSMNVLQGSNPSVTSANPTTLRQADVTTRESIINPPRPTYTGGSQIPVNARMQDLSYVAGTALLVRDVNALSGVTPATDSVAGVGQAPTAVPLLRSNGTGNTNIDYKDIGAQFGSS